MEAGHCGEESQEALHRAYVERYKKETDERLYQHLRDIAAQIGRMPKKSEVPAVDYIKTRLGNWPRIMERAGIKSVSEKHKLKRSNRLKKRRDARSQGRS